MSARITHVRFVLSGGAAEKIILPNPFNELVQVTIGPLTKACFEAMPLIVKSSETAIHLQTRECAPGDYAEVFLTPRTANGSDGAEPNPAGGKT
jgi:hypothetical protein